MPRSAKQPSMFAQVQIYIVPPDEQDIKIVEYTLDPVPSTLEAMQAKYQVALHKVMRREELADMKILKTSTVSHQETAYYLADKNSDVKNGFKLLVILHVWQKADKLNFKNIINLT